MRHRRTFAVVLAAGAALLGAAPASARIVEVGQAPQPATPSCPSNPCLAVSRTTGYQAKVVDSRAIFRVPADGKIVAWSIGLGRPSEEQVRFFESSFGESTARLTVLRPGKRLAARVVTQSPVRELAPYFGQTVQFPLQRALNVKQGYIIALTVPTWAPALTQLLDDGSSWRASRPKDDCDNTEEQTAQVVLKRIARFRCLYKARLVYSATLVTHPAPTPPN
jgi:hypothetical protein